MSPVGPPAPAARTVIDAHLHLSRWWPDVSRTAYRPDLDYSVAGLLREMDAVGVGHALAIQLFLAPSEPDALQEGREIYEQSRGRLLPVGTFDPTREEASVESRLRALEADPHLFGLKLYPGYRSFYPHDRRLDPVYELAHRRGLPVLIHQGDTLDGLGLLKFARPLEVDEVAGRFRDVRFVLCHLGNPWIDEAVEVVYKNPNVYADTSALLPHPSSPYFERAFASARSQIEHAVVTAGLPQRILFGSDWPLEEMRAAVRLIDTLDVTLEDRSAILGQNARRLFGLS